MSSGKEIIRYGDAAMFEAAPIQKEGARITPRVFLLSATPDPLGAVAAAFRMYAGKPTYDLSEITDEERQEYWEESLRTHLKAPWEFIDLHFFVEAVTRSFTHQMVRQRTAVYAQESLRFAVKRGLASEVALPPSIGQYDPEDTELTGLAAVWNDCVRNIEQAYESLIDAGIPAEDARGLLPHCTTTRLHYKTNYRNLVTEMGKRLCTQAQFEWRAAAIGIVKAIRNYNPPSFTGALPRMIAKSEQWQFETIAQPLPQTFTPVCYQAGHCVYLGKLDRGCTIRDRVQTFAENGVSADRWGDGAHVRYVGEVVPGTGGERIEGGHWIPPIKPEEWLANPWAGLTESEADRPA